MNSLTEKNECENVDYSGLCKQSQKAIKYQNYIKSWKTAAKSKQKFYDFFTFDK